MQIDNVLLKTMFPKDQYMYVQSSIIHTCIEMSKQATQ